jgi:hypothetical protein
LGGFVGFRSSGCQPAMALAKPRASALSMIPAGHWQSLRPEHSLISARDRAAIPVVVYENAKGPIDDANDVSRTLDYGWPQLMTTPRLRR